VWKRWGGGGGRRFTRNTRGGRVGRKGRFWQKITDGLKNKEVSEGRYEKRRMKETLVVRGGKKVPQWPGRRRT